MKIAIVGNIVDLLGPQKVGMVTHQNERPEMGSAQVQSERNGNTYPKKDDPMM